jgi:hypothetical protein
MQTVWGGVGSVKRALLNPLAIGAYLILVALYVVPVIILIRRWRSSRPTPTQSDSADQLTSENAPVDGLVATMPVDRW